MVLCSSRPKKFGSSRLSGLMLLALSLATAPGCTSEPAASAAGKPPGAPRGVRPAPAAQATPKLPQPAPSAGNKNLPLPPGQASSSPLARTLAALEAIPYRDPPANPKRIAHLVENLTNRQREAFVEAVLERAGKPETPSRATLVYALGYSGQSQAVPALILFLKDPELGPPAASALLLLHLRGMEASRLFPPLRDALTSENLITRLAAASLLGRLHDTGAAELLLARLERDQPEVRAAAARALGLLGSQAAVETLTRDLDAPHPALRQAAVRALAMLGAKESLPPLIKRLQGPEQGLKNELAVAIGKIGGESAALALLQLLEQESQEDQEAALRGLAHTQATGAVPLIRPFLESPHPPLRFLAAVVIERLGDHGGEEILKAGVEEALTKLKSSHLQERRQGLETLKLAALRDFSFDPEGDPATRQRGLKLILSWWQAHEENRGAPIPPADAPAPGHHGNQLGDETLLASIQFDNPLVPPTTFSQRALRIDFRSPKPAQKRSPVNIAVVFDKSGSMKDGDKIGFVREASRILVENLLPSDSLALLAYNQEVQVLSRQALAVNRPLLSTLFEDLEPGGYTNLSAGLLKGYSEIASLKQVRGLKRVILLTDGLANRGVTDLQELSEVARHYRATGITLSTVGVGSDFDEELLRSLAFAGGGHFYYVAAGEEIPRIVDRELNGLLYVAAQNVTARLSLAPGVTALHVYGADHHQNGSLLTIEAGDIHPGETRTVIIPLKVHLNAEGVQELGRLRLSFDRIRGGIGHVEQETSLSLEATADQARIQASWNPGVRYYRTLYEGLREIALAARYHKQEHFLRARKILDQNLEAMQRYGKVSGDQMFQNGVDLLQHYGKLLVSLMGDPSRGKRQAKALQRLCKCAVYSEYILQQNRSQELQDPKLRGNPRRE